MKTSLFPYRFRKIGLTLLMPGIVLGILYIIFEFEWQWLSFQLPAAFDGYGIGGISPQNTDGKRIHTENFTNELIALLILIGAMLVAFSKEKIEDEFLVHIRLSALLWAVYVNVALSFLAILLLFGFNFLYFMMCNLFSVLLLFIMRYHWLLRKLNTHGHEE